MKTGAIVIGLISSFAFGYAIDDLSRGIGEVPGHWWSTAPILGLLAAAALGALAVMKERSARRR